MQGRQVLYEIMRQDADQASFPQTFRHSYKKPLGLHKGAIFARVTYKIDNRSRQKEFHQTENSGQGSASEQTPTP
jgi:hypothetical protein